MDFLHEIIEGRMRGKPTRGEEFKCYTIWQMMVALLHSNRQLRTERYGDTEKGCQKPAVQQKTTDDVFENNYLEYTKTGEALTIYTQKCFHNCLHCLHGLECY